MRLKMYSALGFTIYLLLALSPAANADTRSIQDCKECGRMRVIPAGTFVMGSPTNEPGRTISSGDEKDGPADQDRELQHPVTIAKAFALGETLVTRAQYAAFVNATHYAPVNECFSSDKAGPGGRMSSDYTWNTLGFFKQADDEPVACVSAIDALAYVAWLSAKTHKHYYLPSEAQWEYAARGGTTTARYWGNDQDQGCEYANGIGSESAAIFTTGAAVKCDDHYVFTSPVRALKPNAFGLYDMLGNLWQPVSDCWHPTYRGAPADGSSWGAEPNCRESVLRGGSFVSNYTSIRAAARHVAWPSARFFNYGFRVAREMD